MAKKTMQVSPSVRVPKYKIERAIITYSNGVIVKVLSMVFKTGRPPEEILRERLDTKDPEIIEALESLGWRRPGKRR